MKTKGKWNLSETVFGRFKANEGCVSLNQVWTAVWTYGPINLETTKWTSILNIVPRY